MLGEWVYSVYAHFLGEDGKMKDSIRKGCQCYTTFLHYNICLGDVLLIIDQTICMTNTFPDWSSAKCFYITEENACLRRSRGENKGDRLCGHNGYTVFPSLFSLYSHLPKYYLLKGASSCIMFYELRKQWQPTCSFSQKHFLHSIAACLRKSLVSDNFWFANSYQQ